jgi:hypothetical protein
MNLNNCVLTLESLGEQTNKILIVLICYLTLRLTFGLFLFSCLDFNILLRKSKYPIDIHKWSLNDKKVYLLVYNY